MNYNSDKKGTKLSILGFGCMRLPSTLGRIDMEKTERLLLKAYEQGINYFDTAYTYQGSEAALGQILQSNNLRQKVFIATKLPQYICKQPSDFNYFFDIQKQRLCTDYIDYYLIHNISKFKEWEQLCKWGIREWIAEKKLSGEIRQIGFSFHGPKDDFPLLLNAYGWDFCQIQYNYMNVNYQAGTEGLHSAAKKNIPLFVMEPLLGGKLAAGLPPKALSAFQKADVCRSPAEWALRWLWNQPEVTMVLSGMNTLEQLDENIRVAVACSPGCMSDGELHTIQEVVGIFKDSYKIPCTGCNYCMPCPQKINIPGLFSSYNASYSMGLITGISQYAMNTSMLSDETHKASSCIKCGKCEQHCPQQIPIRDSLALVEKRLEPLWLKVIFPVFKKLKTR